MVVVVVVVLPVCVCHWVFLSVRSPDACLLVVVVAVVVAVIVVVFVVVVIGGRNPETTAKQKSMITLIPNGGGVSFGLLCLTPGFIRGEPPPKTKPGKMAKSKPASEMVPFWLLWSLLLLLL